MSKLDPLSTAALDELRTSSFAIAQKVEELLITEIMQLENPAVGFNLCMMAVTACLKVSRIWLNQANGSTDEQATEVLYHTVCAILKPIPDEELARRLDEAMGDNPATFILGKDVKTSMN